MSQRFTFTTPERGVMPASPHRVQSSGLDIVSRAAHSVALPATHEQADASTPIAHSMLTGHDDLDELDEQSRRPTRVVVVDDQVIVRAGIQYSLYAYDDIEIVAMVDNGEDALEACSRLHPDVVLMDLMMPGMGGIEAIKALREVAPEIHVIALSGIADGNVVEEAIHAGATGYLLKDVEVEGLAEAVRLARRGIPSLAPLAGQALVHTVANRTLRFGQDLTPQEHKVLELLAAGLSNQQIADQLVITQATVKFHIRRIRSKLGTSTRTETAVQALRHQLIPGQ